MSPTRQLPWLLAALLITALLHCACGHEVKVGSDGLPHKHCHNEFGCICHGATLVKSVDVDQNLQPSTWLCDLEALLSQAVALPTHFLLQGEQAIPPPLSGRALRAHLQSLVI